MIEKQSDTTKDGLALFKVSEVYDMDKELSILNKELDALGQRVDTFLQELSVDDAKQCGPIEGLNDRHNQRREYYEKKKALANSIGESRRESHRAIRRELERFKVAPHALHTVIYALMHDVKNHTEVSVTMEDQDLVVEVTKTPIEAYVQQEATWD